MGSLEPNDLNLKHFIQLPINCSAKSKHISLMWLITLRSVHSPYLHGHWLYLHRNAILSPSFPAYVLEAGMILIWRGAVEICTPTLVKPPACAILMGTTTLYSLSIKCTNWITAIIVHIWCTERCRVLIFFLVIPTECIACLNV